MLELTQSQWLWLLALVAVFFAVYLFARRYRRVKVTYGAIWQRVSRRARPPAWRRLLRVLLTVVLSLAMLGSLVLYAAGLTASADSETPAKLVAVIIDNSPSMLAKAGERTRRELAQARAQEILDRLDQRDRAVLIHFDRGRPIAGRWLSRRDKAGPPPATDLPDPDLGQLAALIRGLSLPPTASVPEPETIRICWWLGDTLPPLEAAAERPKWAGDGTVLSLESVPVVVETFGSVSANVGLVELDFTPPAPGDGIRGRIRAVALSGGPFEVRGGQNFGVVEEGGEFAVPHGWNTDSVTVHAVRNGVDPLPCDDEARIELPGRALRNVTICHPPGSGDWRIVESFLRAFMPGSEIEARELAEGAPVDGEVDLLVLVNVSAGRTDAPRVLGFCGLPGGYSAPGTATAAGAGLLEAGPAPRGLGFEPPDLSGLHSNAARPLPEGHGLIPVLQHIEAGTLAGITGREGRDMLYLGLPPGESNLFEHSSGLLLISRWLESGRGRAVALIPPVIPLGRSVEVRFPVPKELAVRRVASGGVGWGKLIGESSYHVATGPDGSVQLGPFELPGRHEVLDGDGNRLGEFFSFWSDADEQAVNFDATTRVNLGALFRPRERRWQDLLPGLLLWIALGALVLEWLTWLLGWTD